MERSAGDASESAGSATRFGPGLAQQLGPDFGKAVSYGHSSWREDNGSSQRVECGTVHFRRRCRGAELAERETEGDQRQRVKLERDAIVEVEFELPDLATGLWQGSAVLETIDDLVFDNQRYVAVMVVTTPQFIFQVE